MFKKAYLWFHPGVVATKATKVRVKCSVTLLLPPPPPHFLRVLLLFEWLLISKWKPILIQQFDSATFILNKKNDFIDLKGKSDKILWNEFKPVCPLSSLNTKHLASSKLIFSITFQKKHKQFLDIFFLWNVVWDKFRVFFCTKLAIYFKWKVNGKEAE